MTLAWKINWIPLSLFLFDERRMENMWRYVWERIREREREGIFGRAIVLGEPDGAKLSIYLVACTIGSLARFYLCDADRKAVWFSAKSRWTSRTRNTIIDKCKTRPRFENFENNLARETKVSSFSSFFFLTSIICNCSVQRRIKGGERCWRLEAMGAIFHDARNVHRSWLNSYPSMSIEMVAKEKVERSIGSFFLGINETSKTKKTIDTRHANFLLSSNRKGRHVLKERWRNLMKWAR